MNTPRKFYVSQYGFIWSLSRAGFEAFLHDGATGKGYSLDDPKYGARTLGVECAKRDSTRERNLSRLPKHLRGALVVFPLDWTAETFGRALSASVRGDWDTLRFGL